MEEWEKQQRKKKEKEKKRTKHKKPQKKNSPGDAIKRGGGYECSLVFANSGGQGWFGDTRIFELHAKIV